MTKTVLALAGAAALAFQAGAEIKIATIDIEKIVDLHPDTNRNRELLRDTVKDFQKDLDALENSVVAARKAASAAIEESRNPAYGEKKRKEIEEDAQKKIELASAAQREYEEKRRDLQRDLNNQELRMLRLTVREIEGKVAEYAKAKGITAVLPTSGSRLGIAPAVVWAEKSIDITADIMDALGIKEPEESADDAEKAAGDGAAAAAEEAK